MSNFRTLHFCTRSFRFFVAMTILSLAFGQETCSFPIFFVERMLMCVVGVSYPTNVLTNSITGPSCLRGPASLVPLATVCEGLGSRYVEPRTHLKQWQGQLGDSAPLPVETAETTTEQAPGEK